MAKTPKKPSKKPAAKTAKKSDPEFDQLEAADAPAQAAPQAASDAPPVDPNAGPMLSVLAQYFKDASFENPAAPDSLRSGQAQPEVNIDFRIGPKVFDDNTVEVTIMMTATATREGATMFIAEVEYAGLFAVANIGVEQMQPMMMIECPRLLFPYARKILADLTSDGGFPPVMLDMPDFAGMFREELMRRAADAPIN